MVSETKAIIYSSTVMALGQLTMFLHASRKLEHLFPGLIYPFGDYRTSFSIDFNPHPIMFLLGFCYYIPVMAMGIFVVYRMSTSMKMFENAFYYHWASLGFLCIAFTFSYGHGYPAMTTSFVMISVFNATSMLIMAVKRRIGHHDNLKPIPKSWQWWYDIFVINSFPQFSAWYANLVSWFGSISLCKSPVFGFFTVGTAGNLAIPLFMFYVITLIIVDLFVFPHYTKHVRVWYPMILLISFGLYLNVFIETGSNVHSYLYLVTGFVATICWIIRGRFHQHEVKYE